VTLDNTADVETPEHVRFRYRVAGPTRRAMAYLIDLGIRLAALLVLMLVFRLAFGPSGAGIETSSGVALLAAFLLEWGYFVAFETMASGRTPGKRALSLRVIKEGGYPLGFVDSLLRNLLRAADFLPLGYALGLVSMAADPRFQRLGDRVAGTMVVLEERHGPAASFVLSPPPTAQELEPIPHRPALSSWERESLELLVRRRSLGAARRRELAEMVAPLLQRRFGIGASAAATTDPARFLALVLHRAHGHGAEPA
jgi:uncharacterized RDD family membrane protein YckC